MSSHKLFSPLAVDPEGAREQLIEWRKQVALVSVVLRRIFSSPTRGVPISDSPNFSGASPTDVHLVVHGFQGCLLSLSYLHYRQVWKRQAWQEG